MAVRLFQLRAIDSYDKGYPTLPKARKAVEYLKGLRLKIVEVISEEVVEETIPEADLTDIIGENLTRLHKYQLFHIGVLHNTPDVKGFSFNVKIADAKFTANGNSVSLSTAIWMAEKDLARQHKDNEVVEIQITTATVQVVDKPERKKINIGGLKLNAKR